MKNATFTMRIDSELKSDAEKVFSDFGMGLSDVITISPSSCINPSWRAVCTSR